MKQHYQRQNIYTNEPLNVLDVSNITISLKNWESFVSYVYKPPAKNTLLALLSLNKHYLNNIILKKNTLILI